MTPIENTKFKNGDHVECWNDPFIKWEAYYIGKTTMVDSEYKHIVMEFGGFLKKFKYCRLIKRENGNGEG